MLRDSGIFISHSSEDAPLVDAFLTLLERGAGIPSAAIFNSSGPGHDVPSGENYLTYTRERLSQCGIAFQLISPSFLRSQFCLYEAGALWHANRFTVPLLVPPVKLDDVKQLLQTVQLERIDDPRGLDKIYDALCRHLGGTSSSAAWASEREKFSAAYTRLRGCGAATDVDIMEISHGDFPKGYPAALRREFRRSIRELNFYKTWNRYDLEFLEVREDTVRVRFELSYELVSVSESSQSLRLTYVPFRPTEYIRASVGDTDMDLRHPDMRNERGLVIDHRFEPGSRTTVHFAGIVSYGRHDSDLYATQVPAIDFSLNLRYRDDEIRAIVTSLLPDVVSPFFRNGTETYQARHPVLPYQGFRVYWD